MSNPRKHFLVAAIVAGLCVGFASGFYGSSSLGQEQNVQVIVTTVDSDGNVITLEGEEAQALANVILGEGGLIDGDNVRIEGNEGEIPEALMQRIQAGLQPSDAELQDKLQADDASFAEMSDYIDRIRILKRYLKSSSSAQSNTIKPAKAAPSVDDELLSTMTDAWDRLRMAVNDQDEDLEALRDAIEDINSARENVRRRIADVRTELRGKLKNVRQESVLVIMGILD